jgi:hypothetical protein
MPDGSDTPIIDGVAATQPPIIAPSSQPGATGDAVTPPTDSGGPLSASGVQIIPAATASPANAISDREFIKTIQTVKAFKTYLSDAGARLAKDKSGADKPPRDPAAAVTSREDDLDVYRFYAYFYDSKGRRPTSEEWFRLSSLKDLVFSRQEGRVVASFYRSQPLFWIKLLPGWLLLAAIMAFLATAASRGLIDSITVPLSAAVTLLSYLVWTLSLGALGATAYLAVNALGLETDNPFDITDLNSVVIRITIGGVFGFIIALTVSLPAFAQFSDTAWRFATSLAAQKAAAEGSQAPTPGLDIDLVVKVLLPFILGFSTSLVLTILNRLVIVVETFFGVTRRPS